MSIKVTDLSKYYGEQKALDQVSFDIGKSEIVGFLGPNGAGKSTLSYVLTGRDGYAVTGGSATLEGDDLLDMDPEERAAKGLFLSFQYPVEIPGVPVMTFVRTAMNAQRTARGDDEISAPDFIKKSRELGARLNLTADMLKRPLNVGFSGGEKKRMEILQMALLNPGMCILDETDSGLDIDALRIVSEGVNALRGPERSMLVNTVTAISWVPVPVCAIALAAASIMRRPPDACTLTIHTPRSAASKSCSFSFIRCFSFVA